MRICKYLFVFVSAIVIISACQKEISPGDFTESTATGTLLKNASGSCAPMTVGGTYIQNTTLGSTNYLDVQVNFTSTGDYEIKSDTVNGYSFKASGQVTTTGFLTVRLSATGTPVSAGTNIFTIRFDTSQCQVNVVVSSQAAVYTFGNNAGVCTGVTIAGSYTMGIPLTSANSVTVQVDVTTPGSYSISTNTVNGMTFSYSGIFTIVGLQTVVLAGVGTPVTPGPFTFTTAVTGGCTFVVNVTNPAGNLATLTTTPAFSITCASAWSGGNITNDGGTSITARGICYGTAANPTTANNVVNSGTGTGTFSSQITGLSSNTTYHVRAFATNSAGTAYGNDITFTTVGSCADSIYVTGWHDVYNLSGNIRTPKVWKNLTGPYVESSLPFTPLSGNVEANSIYVSGTDVYVAGTLTGVATLWKNGVATSLNPQPTPPINLQAGANSVYVSGSDVYVTGFSQSVNATVWKNGVASFLTSTPYFSIGNSVFISGTDVYVAGYETKMVNFNTVTFATVWKNGVSTYLTNGSVDATANSVFVVGSDVYVVGKEGNAAKIWKNGVASTLPSGSNVAVANSVFVSGSDVYVAGTEDDGASINHYAKLWKNGVATNLTTVGYRNSARSVVVIGTDVYVAGSKSTGGANIMAGVWKNGFFTPLTSGTTDAIAFGIFVKR